MLPFRVIASAALLAAAGCGSAPPSLESEVDLGADPHHEPEVTVPQHPAADGELTRLESRPDPLPDDVLASRLERSVVAFVGEVVGIDHRDVPLPSMGAVPHTFVTWAVEDPVKGGVAGEIVTLRFVGGPADDGVRSLSVSHIPSFVVGERDLLFVNADNGRTACPLVDCESGRLPIVDGHVTAPTGHLLVSLDDGRTRFAEALQAGDLESEEIAENEQLRPTSGPVGTPVAATRLVADLVRPGPSAAALSVTPSNPTR